MNTLKPVVFQLFEIYDKKECLILTASSYEEIIDQIDSHKAKLPNNIGGESTPLNLDRLSLKMIVDLPVPNKRY